MKIECQPIFDLLHFSVKWLSCYYVKPAYWNDVSKTVKK